MKFINRLTSLAILAVLFCTATYAQTVTRGPYLQMQTADSITVHWRTSIATNSVVRYGIVANNLASSVAVTGTRTEHSVKLTGLAPAQQYFYSVGTSTTTLAGNNTYHFYTAPPSGPAADTRIWVIGDSGTANSDATAVYTAFKAWSGSQPADFWIMLGDNAYTTGTDAEYQAAVFNIYPEFLRQLPLWATLGNHDASPSAYSATQSGPYYDIFEFPKNAEVGGWPSGTEAYYSFDYANIHFICLNSQDVSRAANGTMMLWLEADLATNASGPDGKPWVVAFWHHPPYTKGSHDSDTETQLIDMRVNALPVLEAWGVDLVLTGHSHSYERSYLLDGHYGTSTTLDPDANILNVGDGRVAGTGAYEKPDIVAAEHAGAVYAVAGSSGKVSGGALNHPAMFLSLSSLGSMVLDVSGNTMDVVFLDQAGTVKDEFTMVKTPDSEPPLISGVAAQDANHVLVNFNETLNSTQALNTSNYAIAGLSISQAELLTGDRTVRLTTSAMNNGGSYTLVVNNLKDIAGNTILPGTSATFDFHEVMTLSFQDGLTPSPAYAGTRDSYIRQASATTVHGLETTLQVDGDEPAGSSSDMSILLAWDISAIPIDAVVESAHFQLEVTNISTGAYYCYSLLKAWQESQATWNLAATGTAWSTAGAGGVADRGSPQLCTVSAGTLGPLTVSFTQAGLNLVQSWVNSPASNFGLIISNPTTTDGADFHSRQSVTAMARPKLEVTYRVATVSVNQDPVASFLHSCNDLSCDFTDTSTDADGAIAARTWNFGDTNSSTAQNPMHTFGASGSYTVSLIVTDDDGATDQFSEVISVSAPPAFVDQLALADLPSAGSVIGTYSDTHADGGSVQSITEQSSGGKKNGRYSYLSHTWQFSVVAGTPVTLYANAWSGGSSDNDGFQFAWSSNNSSFTNLFTITNQDPNYTPYAVIPASGTLYIRVTDTNRVAGHDSLDTVFVDHLYIRSSNGAPPSPPAAPTGLAVSGQTSGSLTLTWQHPGNDETGFELVRATTLGGTYLPVGTPAGGSGSYTNNGLSSDTTYYFQLRAINGGGASAWAGPASGSTTAPPAISLSLYGFKERGVHVVDLSWSGASSTMVDIIRDGAKLTTTVNDGSYQDNTNNKGGRTYTYQVCEAGTSVCSSEAVVVF